MKISVNELHLLPQESGVYFLFSGKRLIYIGMSKNLSKRITESRLINEFFIYGIITEVRCFYHEYERQLMNLESELIAMFRPIANATFANRFKRETHVAKTMRAVEIWRTPKSVKESRYNPAYQLPSSWTTKFID